MAARKTHDLAVVVRTYTNSAGEEKKQWQNIGARIEFDDGGAQLLIQRHINLAGLPGEGDVRVSLFEPRDRSEQGPRPTGRPPAAAPAAAPDYSDDIPF